MSANIDIEFQKFCLNSEYKVRVTHVNNANDFYIRPYVYEKYLDIIQKPYSHSEDPASIGACSANFNIGALALVNTKEHGLVRGKILSITNDLYQIFAIDYGFIENGLPKDQILEIPTKSACIPMLSTNCSTFQCYPSGGCWNADAISTTKELIEHKAAKIIVRGGSSQTKLQVEFTYPDNIALTLAFCNMSTFLPNTNNDLNLTSFMDYRHTVQEKQCDYKHNTINVGDELRVKFLQKDPSFGFYVAQIDDYIKYKEDILMIEGWAKNLKALSRGDLKIGMPVMYRSIVTSTGKALRATITEIPPEGDVQVKCVDTGEVKNAADFQIFNIRDSIIEMFPIVALYCFCEDGGVPNRYLTTGTNFDITIIKVGNGFNHPHLIRLKH